jgi:uncharacterized membrane protein YbhN (UPF0104 family)
MAELSEASKDTPRSELELLDLKGAMERAHESGERAAQQFTKLLGAIHGGLGVTLAAWLQRIFEQASAASLSPLAWYIAIALGCAAAGLIALALAAILDQSSAAKYAREVQLVNHRIILKNRLAAAEQQPEGKWRAGELKYCREKNPEVDAEAIRVGESAVRLNRISIRVGISSWLCAAAAFVVLAIGIGHDINQIDRSSYPSVVSPPHAR